MSIASVHNVRKLRLPTCTVGVYCRFDHLLCFNIGASWSLHIAFFRWLLFWWIPIQFSSHLSFTCIIHDIL